MTSVPMVVIYIDSTRKTVKMVQDTNEAIGIFHDSGVFKKKLRIIDVARKDEITNWIVKKGYRLEFPLVFIHKRYVGGIEDLRKAFEDKKIGGLLEEVPAKDKENDFPKAFGDQFLDSVEWMLRGMTFGLSNVTNANKNEKGAPAKAEKKVAKKIAADDIHTREFEVIRTNWYWRHQKRVLRFELSEFHRLDPDKKEIRDSFEYKEISKVSITSETYMIIQFSGKKSPEYIQTSGVEMTKQIVEIIKERTPKSHDIVFDWK